MASKKLEKIKSYYEEQIFNLKQLLEISKSLNSTLDYEILTESILYTTMGQIKVMNAALFAKKGIDSKKFNIHRNYKGFEIQHGIDYSVADNCPALHLFSTEPHCWTKDEIISKLGNLGGLEPIDSLDPCMYVPLKAKGFINGILILGERIINEPVSLYEKDYLMNIASLAAMAISNASLFEQTTTDRMTKLRLKHYFYAVLEEKMEESAFSEHPLSVLMADIDFFKNFNDSYGHSCGDEVLIRVSSLFLQFVRSIDVAARYGGEEFCVLFSDTTGKAAYAIAERIRCAVENETIEYEGQKVFVTLSFGIAEYNPKKDYSANNLVDRADHALYQSKERGRNCTTLAE